MFCPNCGAQNQDTANACTKCGFALKAPGAAPKFKGTMLMMNAPPAQAKPQAPVPAQAPPPGAPPPAAGPPQQAAGPAAAAPKPKLKGTMIGVAPPSLGSNVGPAAAPPVVEPVPPPPPPPPEFGGGGFGAPPQQGFGATQQAYPPPGAGYPPPGGYGAPGGGPPPNPPSSAVNPLGGTVVADASAFTNPAFGNAPPQQPPGGYDPNAQPQGYGQPSPGGFDPNAQPGYGQPYNPGAPPQGYGGYDPGAAPPQFGGPSGGGYGAPPQGGYGTPGGFSAAEPTGGAYGAMAPYGSSPPLEPVRNSSMEIPGTVGGQNPIVTVLLIVCTCGIYGIYLLVKGKKAQG